MLVCLLTLFILCSAWLSASETALFSLSSMKVRAFRLGTNIKEKQVAQLLANPRKLLVTILMVNVLMNLLVQNMVSGLFGPLSSWWLTIGIPLLLTLVFGEVLPKSIAYPKNIWISIHAAPTLSFVQWMLKPIRDPITYLTSHIYYFFFFYLKKSKEISIEELKYALRTSKKTGVLNEEEAKLVRGYLNLEQDRIKELMCPRQEVLFYDINEPLSKLLDLFVDQECTRIPVCSGTLENILGIMTSGTYFLHQERIKTSQDLVPFLKSPEYIPESMLGRALLKVFYEKEETMMVVVDEYGSISGIITMEDLLELVIGQITDRRHEKTYFTRSSSDILIASGKFELSEFEQLFDAHLESPSNMATIGGWLTEKIGDIPKSGTKYRTEHFLFHVLASDANRVRRIYIRRLKPVRKKRGKISGT